MSLPIGTVTSMIQTQHTELKTLYTVDNIYTFDDETDL